MEQKPLERNAWVGVSISFSGGFLYSYLSGTHTRAFAAEQRSDGQIDHKSSPLCCRLHSSSASAALMQHASHNLQPAAHDTTCTCEVQPATTKPWCAHRRAESSTTHSIGRFAIRRRASHGMMYVLLAIVPRFYSYA